jgi:hypothetical protein
MRADGHRRRGRRPMQTVVSSEVQAPLIYQDSALYDNLREIVTDSDEVSANRTSGRVI